MKKVYLLAFLLFTTVFSTKVSAQVILREKISDSCYSTSGTPSTTATIIYGVTVNAMGDTGLTLTAHFGDGTTNTTNVTGQSTGFQNASGSHTYASSGVYTLMFVLNKNGAPVDTYMTSYTASCNMIYVSVYNDNNTDCIRDTNEVTISAPFQIEIDSAGTKIDTITIHGSGIYKPLGAGNYYIRLLNPPVGTAATCPSNATVTVVVTGSAATQNADFGVQCGSTNAFDIAVGLNGRFRPTNNSYIDVYADNYTCAAQNATVTLQIDSRYSYSAAVPTPTSVSGNTVTWTFANLSLTNPARITVTVTPATPVAVGVDICNIATVAPTSGDSNPGNNVDTVCNAVVAAFDPNDKSVTPEENIIPGTTLTYNINFENLGNDTAFNIYILDTLSEYLDPNTLTVLFATHNVTQSFVDNDSLTIARFDFANIMLEDKNAPTRNKGAVMFSIKTIDSIAPGTAIPNKAGIYFDINPVVMTNTANALIKPKATNVDLVNSSDDVLLYPNPVNDVLHIRAANYTSVKLMNSLGQLVKEQPLSRNDTKINVGILPPGVYSVLLQRANGSVVTRKIGKL